MMPHRIRIVTLQALTKPMSQLVAGSCFNAVLAISALVGGLTSGLAVAVISPVLAFLLGIAPHVLTVSAVMIGNIVYVVLLSVLTDKSGKDLIKQAIAWSIAAVAKFAALYTIVVGPICGILSESLLASGMMKAPMLKAMSAAFS